MNVGGAANWAGTEHERAVAAFLACHCLAAHPVSGFGLPPADSVPMVIRLQAAEPVDDVVCELSGGGAAYLQVKTRLDFTRSEDRGLSSVAGQWSRLGRERTLDPRRDRVLAVAESASGDVVTLQRALQRGRRPRRGPDTAGELAQLVGLDALLSGLAARRRTVLRRCARIWIEGFADDEATTAALARMLLRGVVPAGRESDAWHRLLKAMGDGARLRLGFDREDLADELRAVGIELAADVPGSPGAVRAAVVRYRRRLAERGGRLTFVGLGATIPALDVEVGDADVRAAEGGPGEVGDRDYSTALPWWIRRRGRVLLTGLPGSGKSTALRATAGFYAAERDWPLPIVVSLDRVADALATRSLRDAILDLATEDAAHAEREDLRRALDAALQSGEALLAFDALDETRAARHAVLRGVSEFLDDLGPDLEVVLSTRDVAYADARMLGFAEVRLQRPGDVERTVDAVLRTLAGARRVPEDEVEAWVADRVRWVQRALGGVALDETPLIAVLLAALAAGRSTGALPARRGVILWEVVRAVVERWELEKPVADRTVAGLSGPAARRALLEAFAAIAVSVIDAETPTTADATGAAARRVAEVLAVHPVKAEEIAEEAVAFWDMAGFFVAQGADERVSARLRLFAEIGAARRGVQLDDAQLRSWVEEGLRVADRRETLRLACELRPTTANLAIEVAEATGAGGALVAADCADSAATLSDAAREALVGLLLEQMETDPATRWEVAGRALGFARTAEQRARLLDQSRRLLPADQLATIEAAAVVAWDRTGPEAEAALRAVLRVAAVERPAPAEETSGDMLRLRLPDRLLMRTVVAAARRLVPGDRALAAELVRARRWSGRAVSDIREIVIDAGFGDLVRDEIRREYEDYGSSTATDLSARLDERLAFDRAVLEQLRDSAEPAELTFGERRRLDALVDFWTTLDLSTAPAFEPSDVRKRHPGLVEDLIDAFLWLSGLDRSTVAAQARQLLREAPAGRDLDPVDRMLHIRGSETTLAAWDRVADRATARDLLLRALAIGRWLPPLAASALAAGGLDRDAAEALRRWIPRMRRPWNRTYAAMLFVASSGDEEAAARELLDGEDAALREAAGWYVAHTVRLGTEDAGMVAALLDDPDDEVRAAFLRELVAADPSPAVLAAAEAADWAPRGWICSSCGTPNEPGVSGCRRCRTVGGATARALTDLRRRAEGT